MGTNSPTCKFQALPLASVVYSQLGTRNGNKRCAALLVCYLDDSGKDPQNLATTLAGYVAEERSWANFEAEVGPLLTKYQVGIRRAQLPVERPSSTCPRGGRRKRYHPMPGDRPSFYQRGGPIDGSELLALAFQSTVAGRAPITVACRAGIDLSFIDSGCPQLGDDRR